MADNTALNRPTVPNGDVIRTDDIAAFYAARRRGDIDTAFAEYEADLKLIGADLPMDTASRMKRAGKTRSDIEMQGGALASKPGIKKLTEALDDHSVEWEWSENGGITAYAWVGSGSDWKRVGKHFDEKTSLKTLRNWLGY